MSISNENRTQGAQKTTFKVLIQPSQVNANRILLPLWIPWWKIFYREKIPVSKLELFSTSKKNKSEIQTFQTFI